MKRIILALFACAALCMSEDKTAPKSGPKPLTDAQKAEFYKAKFEAERVAKEWAAIEAQVMATPQFKALQESRSKEIVTLEALRKSSGADGSCSLTDAAEWKCPPKEQAKK